VTQEKSVHNVVFIYGNLEENHDTINIVQFAGMIFFVIEVSYRSSFTTAINKQSE
jgi:hypothetical protein